MAEGHFSEDMITDDTSMEKKKNRERERITGEHLSPPPKKKKKRGGWGEITDEYVFRIGHKGQIRPVP